MPYIRLLNKHRGAAGRATIIEGYSIAHCYINYDGWLHYDPDGFCIPPREIMDRVHEEDLAILIQTIPIRYAKNVLPKIFKDIIKV